MSSTFAFATDTRLSDLACRVGQVLTMLARGKDRVTHSTETIATKLGRSVRSVQAAIAELVRCGYVRREWSNALSSRRALVLLWRGAGRLVQLALPFDRESAADAPAEAGSTTRPDCAVTTRPDCVIPPHPPYKDWRTIREMQDDDAKPLADAKRPEPAKAPQGSSSSSGDSPPRIQGQGPRPEPPKRAEADEATEAAVVRAVEVFGADHAIRARALARAFGPEPVRRAVDLAEPKVRREGKPWGYVVGIVRNWSVEGMPAGPTPPADPREHRRSVMAEAMRIFRQRRAPADGR